jgi:titin
MAQAAQAAQLGLSWTDNATDETGYLVERRDGASATFAQIASLPANATAYLDPALPAGSAFCYRVRAFNAIGPSAYTNEAARPAAR